MRSISGSLFKPVHDSSAQAFFCYFFHNYAFFRSIVRLSHQHKEFLAVACKMIAVKNSDNAVIVNPFLTQVCSKLLANQKERGIIKP